MGLAQSSMTNPQIPDGNAPNNGNNRSNNDNNAPTGTYEFQQRGITYSSEISMEADGTTTIDHYITQNGEQTQVGFSTISPEGQLTNSFDVPISLRELGISERMYDEAISVGYRSVAGSYAPNSTNGIKFYANYDPAAGNAEAALLRTPAGQSNVKRGFRPTSIQVDPDTGAITCVWVKGE